MTIRHRFWAEQGPSERSRMFPCVLQGILDGVVLPERKKAPADADRGPRKGPYPQESPPSTPVVVICPLGFTTESPLLERQNRSGRLSSTQIVERKDSPRARDLMATLSRYKIYRPVVFPNFLCRADIALIRQHGQERFGLEGGPDTEGFPRHQARYKRHNFLKWLSSGFQNGPHIQFFQNNPSLLFDLAAPIVVSDPGIGSVFRPMTSKMTRNP